MALIESSLGWKLHWLRVTKGLQDYSSNSVTRTCCSAFITNNTIIIGFTRIMRTITRAAAIVTVDGGTTSSCQCPKQQI